METIANPALTVLDILERTAKAAYAHGVPLIGGINSILDSANCRPIEWGADIATHLHNTKYMDGHGKRHSGGNQMAAV